MTMMKSPAQRQNPNEISFVFGDEDDLNYAVVIEDLFKWIYGFPIDVEDRYLGLLYSGMTEKMSELT